MSDVHKPFPKRTLGIRVLRLLGLSVVIERQGTELLL